MIRFKLLDSTVPMMVSDASTINGKDGVTPHIGDNGNWYLGDVDTGNPSRGETGADGYTPVRGTDYWTAADQNAIVSQAVTQIQPDISELNDDLATKLPKSPANWGPWTADEQAAARDRMSAAKALSGNVVFDETITESVDAMGIPAPGGWNNILLRVLYPKAGAEYAGGVSTGEIFATAGKTNSPYQIYVYLNSITTPTYNERRVFFDFNLTKRGIYAELNRFFAGITAQATTLKFSVLASMCAYSDVETIRFACSHIPAGTQFILYAD